jgi:hypothetical protein
LARETCETSGKGGTGGSGEEGDMAGESGLGYNAIAFLLILGLFAGMLLMLTIGQRWGQRSLGQETDVVRSRLTGVETAIFGLMGLMIAFTFSGAAAPI